MSQAGSTRTFMAASAVLYLIAGAPAQAQDATTADIDRLMAVIEAQQAQLDAVRAELDAMKARPAPAPASAPVAVAAAPAPVLAPTPDAATPEDRPSDVDARPEAQMVEEGFTWRDQSGRSLTLSGQVNPALNIVDDGVTTNVFIVDNDTSSSRLRFDVEAPLGDTSVGGTLEIGASPNNSNSISQLEPDVSASYDVRKAEVTFRNDQFGRLMLGKGSGAADDTAEYDVTLVAGSIMYAGVADVAGGVFFTNGEEITDTPINVAFYDYDPGNLGRIRYDSPMLGPLQGSVSYGQESQWAAALSLGGDYGDWTGWTVGNFTGLAAASVYDDDTDGVDYSYAASASVLHDPTGLSLTLSAGGQRYDEGDDPQNRYVKLGWDTTFWPNIGQTGLGVDYTNGENVSGEGDEGESYGIAAVQQIERYGIELYTQVRWYDLESATEPGLKNIMVGTFGTKLTF